MGWSGHLMAATMVGLLGFAAWTDIATRTIPDGTAIGLVLLGLVSRLAAGVSGLAMSVAVTLLLFAFLLAAHSRGILGGGDVKLAAAAAVGLPAEVVYRFVVITAVAGGVLALVHLVLRLVVRGGATVSPPPRGAALPRRIVAAERWRIARHGSLPYGLAIACGGIWAILASWGF